MITIKKIGRFGYFTELIPSQLEAALYNRLAYRKEGYQFMKNPAWSWVRFYKRKKRIFPWGLINKVKIILEDWQKQYSDEFKIVQDDGFLKFNDLKLSPKLRPYQVDSIIELSLNHGGILAMPTGSGKTLTAIEFLKTVIFKKTLVVVHTRDLLQQWEEELVDLNSDGSGKIVQVKTYQSLNSKKNKVDLKEYDVVIWDECHHVSANVLFKLAIKCSNAVLVGLSATPYRAYKPETMKINAALGEIVYSISIRELIDQGYLCDAEVRVIKDIDYPHIEYWDEYPDVVQKCIVENQSRNDAICSTALEESYNGTVLILVEKIEHGETLYKILKEKEDKIIFVHGSSKEREQIFTDVKAGKYNIVIATKIYGEGVNITRLKTLILAGGGKSSVAIIQKIGRLLRLFLGKDKAIIYDFADDVKYLKKHFQKRYDIYKETFEVNII